MPINAMAIDINDEEAQKLKSSFQVILDYQKDINDMFGGVQLIYDGELSVEQKAEHYTVILPHISIKNPNAGGETNNFTLDFGIITINAKPDEKDGYWQTAWNFPSNITMSDSSEDPDIIINFGQQKIVALLNEQLGYFTKMDFNLSDITIKSGDENLGLELGSLQFYTNWSEDNGDGDNLIFSGPAYVTMKNLLIHDKDESESINLGELKMEFDIDNFKLPTLEEYKKKVLKHADTFKSLEKLETEDDKENIDGKNVTDMMLDLYQFDMDGYSLKYSINNLEIKTIPEENEANKFTNIKVGTAAFGLGVDGLKSDKGILNFNIGYSDIKTQPSDPEYQDILPQNVNFDISAENIPYKILGEIAKTTFKSVSEKPDTAQMVGIGLMMRLPAILASAGTQLVVKNNNIKNDIYALTLDGKAKTDLTSITGFTAQFYAIFNGLDTLLNIAKTNASNTESTNAEKFSSLVSTLEQIQKLGVKEGDLENAPYMFNFEATPEGSFLINGKDPSVALGKTEAETVTISTDTE